jgi:hypothetical protein
MLDGKKIYLTDEEQAEKDIRDATPAEVGVLILDSRTEVILDLLAESTGKTREQIEDLVKAKDKAKAKEKK